MRSIYNHSFFTQYLRVITMATAIIFFVALFWVGVAAAASNQDDRAVDGKHLVTVYDSGTKQVILAKTTTVGQVLEQSNIAVTDQDVIEPALDTEINSSNFIVNIYRTHPVLVIDGMRRVSAMSSHSSPRDIARDAGLKLHDEDTARFVSSADILEVAGGMRVEVTRAKPVQLSLYGKDTTVYTQKDTVAELLKEKQITLAKKDTVSVKLSAPITKNMKIEIWRNGVQTTTVDEKIAFSVRQIEDANQPIGYRKIKTPGIDGKKRVTYVITVKNGKEVKRKEIQSVTLKQPSEQVEIVGAKPSFSGDFAEALSKLRACEAGGNYANKNNPLYRGAYQFGYTTWGNRYGIYDPADASPAQQDAAARELYERRGWQPWPVCGASLPDSYR